MDASHRAALLTASCLHTPVNPRTKAPAALYERVSERASLEDGVGQESLTPGRDYSSIMCTDCKDWLDLSNMYLSNQEYYLKLEELKNAHLETMAKLEEMYQNKLFLKDVQPLTDTDMIYCKTYRSAWETKPFQLQNMHRSFSASDLNSSFHSLNFSDATDEKLELETSDSDAESLTLDKTENAWDGYSLEDYSLCSKTILPKLNVLKLSKKKKKWFPKITVPEPFQMTIREAKRKQQNIKSKSLMELENNLLKKQLEEEAECQKQFRANPVPAHVFVPLYHEIMQENEERRKSFRERRGNFLLATQKPFQFIEREAQKKELRKMQFSSPEKKAKMFKAKAVPKFVSSSEMREKLKEEELYRDIRIQVRSEELLRNSSLPNSRLGNKGAIRPGLQNCFEQSEELKCKSKTKVKVPDFETLHKKFQKQLQKHKNVKSATISEPFNLHTPNISSHKEKILEDIDMDEATLKETRWPYVSARCPPRTLNGSSYPSGCLQSPSPRITASTRKRLEAIRKSAEEKKKVEEEHKRREAKQKERARKLQRLIATRAEANDPHQSLAEMLNSKLKLFRKHEKQRMKEYLQELEEIEERVEKRPLLLEQATQKNARLAAEKHYSDLLQELGLCEDFISKKGQTVTEEFLQDSYSNSFENLAANVESDNEHEEKRESEEDISQVQSAQHSGEEEEEKEDKKEEENEKDEGAATQSDHADQETPEHESENDYKDSVEKSSDYEG
ncbi:protein FAM161A isoform X1 [Crotalus tigris]|uniref:protein FAM161A isoform X1 n=2 Tax=Crotalus tigris TaxID=88082 RepID=UPI00192F2D64|nr:protein FAM161A isoform X1 [Crotalus tigris]